MKRLIKNIFLLLLPILILLSFVPLKKRLLYQGLTDDCFNHAIWIYDRIHNNTKPIDIAFIGSSHTINGVNDRLIEEKLSGTKMSVANIGYCRLGVNLNYVLLQEVLKTKKIKKIIIEVREDEDRYSHPIFPYIADTKDVLGANLLFNRDFISDYYRHYYYRLEVIHNYIFDTIKNNEIKIEDFGFASSADTASPLLLKSIKEERAIPGTELSEMGRNFYMKYPRVYLSKMAEICKLNNIQMLFLYLPEYGSPYNKPKEFNTYIQYGKVLIPPHKLLNNTSYWHDGNHLNIYGAEQLSNWIADEIILQGV